MKKEEQTENQFEIEKKTDFKIYEAFRLIEKNNILYFRFLKRMNFIVDKKFKHIGAVAYNPKKKKIFVVLQESAVLKNTHLDFKNSKYQDSVKDIAGLLEHETGHVLYDHIFHMDVSINHKLKNIAEDFIINDGCMFISSRLAEIQAKDSESILKGGCFFANIKDKIPALKGRTTHDLTSLELYRILKDDQNKNKDKNQQQQNEMKEQIQDLLSKIDQKIKEQENSIDEQSVSAQKELLKTQKELTLKLKKLKMKEESKISGEVSKKQETLENTLTKG